MTSDHQKTEKDTASKTETLYTLEEVARLLQVQPEVLHRSILAGIIHSLEKDGDYWISESEVARIQDKITSVPPDPEFQPEEPQEVLLKPEPESQQKQHQNSSANWNRMWKDSLSKIIEQFHRLKKPLSHIKLKEWIQGFFRVVEKKKQTEVYEEYEKKQVSVKLGFMTGQNEMYCDFCEVRDHFYPGAIFADVYVDGMLKWLMCPNCLNYCRQQAHGSLEQNIRARFNHLAHRLEREAHRARNLAASEDFHTPSPYEWEAWETASVAMQEVASAYASEPGYEPHFHQEQQGWAQDDTDETPSDEPYHEHQTSEPPRS
ncbi:hypothetical protein GXN76_13105 [Kroppenstedtia pulmonis]|uniref:Helix-turn-helix domain-containing protein n=1 Tax=Kroppenstedtia pulmonis TaxID=1380685 RepID=A0A7D3XK82_9BACL|nr:hypothetical protein [Kroppenstedtia pulmonis]QKG85319.1 hypothetical protein GXN76_13105 [Kroppenstedtia pulmonis]